MSVRSRRGHHTSTNLRLGMRDQYAVQRSYGTVTVELYFDGDCDHHWHVAEIIAHPANPTSTEHSFEFLKDARRAFTRLVRKHP